LLTYFVTSYWQLFVLRALTGISIGGCLPLVFNLLGDLFDAQHRTNVLSGVLIATGAGTAIGQALAGLIGSVQGACVASCVVRFSANCTKHYMLCMLVCSVLKSVSCSWQHSVSSLQCIDWSVPLSSEVKCHITTLTADLAKYDVHCIVHLLCLRESVLSAICKHMLI